MTISLLRLAVRSGGYYWRTNIAVLLGVSAAVAVLGGALLVGDSVRGSLRDIALGRLGKADQALSSAQFFRSALAADIRADGLSTAPLIVATAFVTHEPSGRRAGNVVVYGVDERFWTFHGVQPPGGLAISPALAAELGVDGDVRDEDGSQGTRPVTNDVLLVRLQRPSEIPIESLFGRKEEIGRTLRLTLSEVLPRERLGEFALRPQQTELRALFAPLQRVQRDLGVEDRVNTVLMAGVQDEPAARAARAALALEDLGLKLRPSEDRTQVIVDAAGGILSGPLEQSIRDAGAKLGSSSLPVFTYLANTMRVGDREVPYSLITATDLTHVSPSSSDVARGTPPVAPRTSNVAPGTSDVARDPIVLNDWTARELKAKPGDPLEIEYYLWDANAGLTTHTSAFTVGSIVPIAGFAADRQLAPEYPGITGAESLADWDPPFPLDLARVRLVDEKYWDDHRATPKAFISYEKGRELWQTRYGGATSLRFVIPAGTDADVFAAKLRGELQSAIRPEALGVSTQPVRRLATEASVGATDFGQYFTYFSFFIVVSALLLAILFFRLGVEQRLRQIGILRAAGFTVASVRRLLMIEAVTLASIGGLIGIVGALAYGQLIMHGLRTWWIGAVGTTQLTLHVTPSSLAGGALGGIVAAIICVFLSLRAVAKLSPRALLAAQVIGHEPAGDLKLARRNRIIGVLAGVLALAALAAGFLSDAAQAGAFFGGGAAALISAMFLLSSWLRSRPSTVIAGRGTGAVLRLGFRSAAFRPSRSVLSAALIASAAFIIVSVDAFRKSGGEVAASRSSGTGGFALIATSELPLVHNPNEAAGREALIVSAPELRQTKFTRFRVRPGDDASCLNLYRPTAPTIVAPERGFIEEGRFEFSSSLAETEAERANPWRLLQRPVTVGGPIPVIADATSLQYVLHAKVGGIFSMDIGADRALELQFVGAIKDSVLQGELLMSEENFVRLFPSQQGYRYFLIDAPVTTAAAAGQLAGVLEKELTTFGFDAVTAAERLEAFHRVENTYLSTFQSLGGLGLLLGTIGLAAVMFRNVLERRRELAVLRAVGYDRRRVSQMILAEAVLLLGAGLGAGILSALIAVVPAWTSGSGRGPGMMLVLLLAGVVLAGVLSSVVATRAALGGRMLDALRSE
ncbi:MAG: ABC transporter permease [Acidobacteria bacterium]|nr:ABC transporter permease [Acidobacteriota bacterium]